jgi:acyl-CoA reductase-like NAD-dependent aldehyde dehydrogenase
MSKIVLQLIDGQWRESHSKELIEVTDPATQQVLALAPKASHEEIEAAIASAKLAFLSWREVPVSERARLMLRYQHLLKEHHDELAEILAQETGKTFADVGSVVVGQHIYRTGSAHLKRVQAFAGAKNHMVIMPDANKEQVLSNLVRASCGATGQRCMAISVAVFVGESKQWIAELQAQMAELQPGYWNDPAAAFGPLISQQAKQRVQRLISEGKAEGAECLLDGSHCTVPGYPNGNWLGPTLFRGVSTNMGLYREEIFGPVLVCMEVDSLEAAIQLVNASPYGNGTSIFTNSGGAARQYHTRWKSARSASMCRSPCHCRSSLLPAGKARFTATYTPTANKAYASTPRPKPSPAAGLMTAAAAART